MEKKFMFQIFPIFIFRVMVIILSFCDVITPSFDGFFTITQKIKIGEFFYYLPHRAHSPSSIKTGPKLKGGVSVLVMDRKTATAYNRIRNCDAVVRMTSATTTAIIFFNNRKCFKKFLHQKKFILPMLRFKL